MGTATFDFTGDVVLITGGTKGVGRGIAARFEQAGAQVVVCARSAGDNRLPGTWDFRAADVRDGEQAWELVDGIVATHGHIDVVINNAGGSPPVETASAAPRLTERIVALNLLAPLYVSQRANHHMQGRAGGGAIVNIGSVSAQRQSPTAAAYGAAKAGMANFAMTAAHEWAPRVRINTVMAGIIRTEQATMHYGDDAAIARIEGIIPMGRMATPDDIADACMYLASSAAAYVTGATVLLDGGGDRPAFLDALEAHDVRNG